MSSATVACERRVGQTGYKTPLLVPSYSSRGFSPIGQKFSLFSAYTTSASLFSAYDIHHGALPIDAAYNSDIVLLDSGGYEAYSNSELALPKQWSVELYRAVLSRLENRTTIIPVTFDYRSQVPTENQLEAGHQLGQEFSQFSWDCLIKPESPNEPCVNVDAVVRLIPSSPHFAIFGFTETELGHSLLERAKNVRRIRETLIQTGQDCPIHVFGCLDPLTIRCYFAAGADLFDGLQWLRSVIIDEGLFRMSTRIIRERFWDKNESAVEAHFRKRNLGAISQLQHRLVDFARTGRIEALGLSPDDEAAFVKFMDDLNGGVTDVRN